MTTAGNLFAQQEANRKASRRLVAGFVIFLAWLGFGGDFIWYLASSRAAESAASGAGSVHVFPGVGLSLLLLAGAMAWWAYRFGATSLVKATGAHELTQAETDGQRQLMNIVDEMTIASGASRPRVWLVPDDAPNAFATGVHANDAHLAVTTGLLDVCTRDEVQAVVAHEMGHIVNFDVRLMTLLTSLVGAVALVHNVASNTMRFGGGGRGGRSKSRGDGGDSKGAGALVIVLLVVWVISWLVAPLVTRYMVMKVGRSREFLADAMSAQFTRNPAALADALVKIGGSAVKPTAIPKSSAQLCISDPFHSAWDEREGRIANLMATHPPLRDRVSRLRSMAYQEAGSGESFQRPLSMSEA